MRKTALFCLFLWGSTACNKQVLVIQTAIPTDTVEMSVDPTQPGIVIPPDFAGLSLETSVLTGSSLSVDNTALVKMVKLLGPYGQLRIGGSSEDQIFWAEKARNGSKDVDSLYTTDLVNLFDFARAIGWKVTLGLNFAQSPETVDAYEATYALNAGGTSLYALEVGNAPDLYDSLNLKPAPYTYLDFQAQWLSYVEALQASAKNGLSFEGPSTAAGTDDWVLPFISAEYTHLVEATRHYYRVSSPGSSDATIAHLLGTRDDNFLSQVT
ncbi:MAG TPA: hypothetical protein VK859_00140, partial [bacterium]|nr:hypothetical protein [bacterium]